MNECACVYVDCDEPADFHCAKEVTARKSHICCECNRKINPKEKYENTTCKWDDEIHTYKTCIDCLSVRNEFFCYGYVYEAVWEYLFEHIRCIDGEVSSDCLVSLTPAARDKICDMIEETWAEEE